MENLNNFNFFVRHGERQDVKSIEKGDDNNAKMQLNTLITKTGEKEAIITGKFVKDQIEFLSYSTKRGIQLTIYSSPYIRCVQTSLGIINGLKPSFKIDKLLIDFDIEELQLPRYYAPNSKLRHELAQFFKKTSPPEIQILYLKSQKDKKKEVEAPMEGFSRVKSFLENIKKNEDDDKLVVNIYVTHAFFQKGVMIYSKQGAYSNNLIDYCSINSLTKTQEGENRAYLVNFNGHLNQYLY